MASQQQRAVKLIEPVNPPQVAFRVTHVGIDYLSRFSGPLHVVSVVGTMRCGKSYIQKLLADDLGVFELGHTVASCTAGIDVFVRPHPSGRGHLVLLDVEGQGSPNRNATYDAALTTIAMLLSSLVVYNCMTVGAQEDVSNLRLLSGFMQQVVDKTVATTRDTAEGDPPDRFFPALLWLLRDFALQLVDGDGNACDADTYLKSILLAPERPAISKAAKEKNRMLQDIESIFSTQRACLRTLPRPCVNEADFALIAQQGYGADVVRQEFREQVAVVIRDILAKAGVKKFAGNRLNGGSFAALAQHLCATLDANGVPEVTSAWQQVCQQQLTKALDAAWVAFKEIVAATLAANQPAVPPLSRTGLPPPALQTPVREDKLQQCIEHADASAQQAFFALACAPGDEEAKQLSDSLHTWRKQECKRNEEVAVAFCEALLGRLYEPIQAGIRAGTYTREGGFTTYSQHVREAMLDYNDCCSRFVPVQVAAQRAEAFARSIEGERHLVMESDRALTEAQRQAALDAEKLQQEELSRNREREAHQAELNRLKAEHSAQLKKFDMPMTPQQLEAELRRRTQQGEVQNVVKVLVLGNSGTGKSFLLNCLLGANVFEHSYQVGSCTFRNSFALHVAGTTAYVLCNVPGLLEADKRNIARNQLCIEAGFQMLPDALTVVAFVIDSATGGRLKADDVEAYKSVAAYVALPAASTAVIANGMRNFRANEAAVRASYQTSTTAMVKQLMEREVSVHYIERLDEAACTHFSSQPVRDAGSIFEAAIASLTPAFVQPKRGARLKLDRNSKTAELQAMKAMILQLEKQHETSMRQMNEAWKQLMRQFQVSMQAQIRAVQEAASRRQERRFTIGLGPLSLSFG